MAEINAPTVNVQPRYPERQNSVLAKCRPNNVKSLANKFTQLALDDESNFLHKTSCKKNSKINKPQQSSVIEKLSSRFRNSNTPTVLRRADNQSSEPIPKSQTLNKKMSTMYITRVRITANESNAHVRRPNINENDKNGRRIAVWSSSRSCTDSYLGRSTNLTFAINSQARKFSTLPLPKRPLNSSAREKTNAQYLQKTVTTNRSSALQQRDMNKIHLKHSNETADNFLNEKLSTSQKQIYLIRDINSESNVGAENNYNGNGHLFDLTCANNKNNNQLRQLRLNSIENSCEKSNISQLMHPDWRRVPWKEYFGWTDEHQILVGQLQEQVRAGELVSIYYGSAEQHAAAGAGLAGPVVATVRGMLEAVGRAVDAWRESRLAGGGRRSPTRWRPSRLTCYDADDED